MRRIFSISVLDLFVVLIGARDDGHLPSVTSARTFNAEFAALRNYPYTMVRPCLIEFPGCTSMYPLATPCLASTDRCPLESRLAAWAASTPSKIDDLLVPLLGASLRVIVVVVAIFLGLPILGLPAHYASVFSKLTSLTLIAAVAAVLFRAVGISQSVVLTRFDITAADNLKARRHRSHLG
jgi:hypothetical protein